MSYTARGGRAAQGQSTCDTPAGSVEQHGPHLPAGTDSFAANIIAEAVAERMNGLVIPGGPLGVTPFHMPFEATITLSHETYIRVIVETCQSLAQHGAKRLMLLNWHEEILLHLQLPLKDFTVSGALVF